MAQGVKDGGGGRPHPAELTVGAAPSMIPALLGPAFANGPP